MKRFCFALLVFAVLSWFAVRFVNAELQRLSVDALAAIDVSVVYQSQSQANEMSGPFIPLRNPPGPQWLHPILGVDFFDTVVSAYGDFEFSDAHVHRLSSLHRLRSFEAEGSLLTDKGIAQISKIKSIASLNLSGSQLSDEGTKCFQEMPSLTTLQLWDTSITDKSVDHLSQLKRLERLDLGDSLITKRGITKLQAALPGCEIQWSKRDPSTPLPDPIAQEYVELVHELITIVLSEKSLEDTIKFYGPEAIDHVVLDSTTIPWPKNFNSKTDIEYVHLRTYREIQKHEKRLYKTSRESLCLRIDKFDLNAKIRPFDGPIKVTIYNRGGSSIGGCSSTFSAKKSDGKWKVVFLWAIDP